MNIYVETNFVFELVFEQEEYQECEEILSFCETRRVNIIMPAYCLAEPHEKLIRQVRKRLDLKRNIDNELSQLFRTASYAARVESMRDIARLLVQSNEEEKQRFIYFRDRLMNFVHIIPLTIDILREAATYEVPFDLTPQDAIVYASVIYHLRQNSSTISCFLNKNSKDFDNPDIVDNLKSNNCTMIPRFRDGNRLIQSLLNL